MIEIGGLQKTTLIDYPGQVAATVFLIGCNFRCPFCYSAELVLPEKIEKQPRIKRDDFFNFLGERKGLLQGVVVCGGEPTVHPDLPGFLWQIKKMGFLVKLDTNGSNPKMIDNLIKEKLVDYIAMDVKGPLENYADIVKVKIHLKDIKESIETIKGSDVDYEFRMTIVPTIHTREDVINVAQDVAPAKRFFLQNFRPEKTIDPQFEKIKPYPKEFLSKLQEEISSNFDDCGIR